MIALNSLVFSFLIAIQGVESSGGIDLNHSQVLNPASLQFGDSALGRFGLMPNTILMLKKDPQKVKFNSAYEFEVARLYALKVLGIAKGDPYKASVLWLKGHSASPTIADYQTPRFKKFQRLFK